MFSRGRKHQKNHKKITRTPSLMRYDISKKNCGRRRKINVRRTALRGVSMRLILTTFSPIPVPRSRKTQSGENSFPDPDPFPLRENCLYACMLGFCRTLEIIMRTLREVVNRVRLCGHHTRSLFVCFTRRLSRGLLACLFAGNLFNLGCLVAGILSHSGDHHAHSTRSGKQSEIVWSVHPKGLAR